jgi:predicted dienelactone hydrolase
MHIVRTQMLSAAGALLFVACIDPVDDREPLPFEPASETAAPDPVKMGPFPVGVRTITVIDESRRNPAGDGPRTLVTEVWYPAVQSAKDDDKEVYDLHAYLPDSLKDTVPEDALGSLATNAVRDAAVQPDRGPFPLILFSHGKGGIRMQSTFYTIVLASHGYVVAAPDHQGDTLIELLEEGDVVISTTVDSFLDRPLDISHLIDHFEELAADDPLAGKVDLEKIGVSGHSFGALTTFRTAGGDARVRAIVAQTPVGVGLVEAGLEIQVKDFGIPAMIQSAGLDRTLPADLHAASLWEAMQRPRYALMLQTAGHFTYSDLCVLDLAAIDAALDVDVGNVLEDGCGPTNLGPEKAFPAINNYAVGFFNLYLRASDGSAQYLDENVGRALGGASEVGFVAEP